MTEDHAGAIVRLRENRRFWQVDDRICVEADLMAGDLDLIRDLPDNRLNFTGKLQGEEGVSI